MRLFFALEPEPALAARLASWRDRFAPADGRPVPPANFHITLAFIGDVQQARLERLCADVDEWLAGADTAAGELSLDQPGFWPRPGIYWLGPGNWPRSLERLASGLAGIAVRNGGRRERRAYRPHLTLYRGCRTAPPEPSAMPSLLLRYDGFALFESIGTRQGVHYRALEYWPLGPGEAPRKYR